MPRELLLSTNGSTVSTGLSEAPQVERRPLAIRAAPLVFLASLLLSLAGSWRPSLWTDEAATISAASRSWSELAAMAANVDAVHTAYYALMHVWLDVVPATEFLLRLPSAVATATSALVVYLLGLRLGGARLAVYSAFAFITLPRVTWMGIEGRPYAFSALAAAAATLALVNWSATSSSSRRRAHLLGYAGLVGAGVVLHIYVALLVVCHGITLLLSPRITWRARLSWLLAATIGVALAAPAVLVAVEQTGQLGSEQLRMFSWLRSVAINQWFLGETPTIGTEAGLQPDQELTWKLGAIVLAALSWTLIGWGCLRRGRLVSLLRLALPWLAVPTLLVGAYSLAIDNMYNPRYFTFGAPAIALLIGAGLQALRQRWLRATAMLTIALCAAPVYLSQRFPYAKSGADWAAVAAFVEQNAETGQAVYFSPRYPITGAVVGQTARGIQVAYPDSFVGLQDLTLIRTPEQDDNLTGSSRLLAAAIEDTRHISAVWVVRRNDYAYVAEDDGLLRAAGFAPAKRWMGPLTSAIEFARAQPG